MQDSTLKMTKTILKYNRKSGDHRIEINVGNTVIIIYLSILIYPAVL